MAKIYVLGWVSMEDPGDAVALSAYPTRAEALVGREAAMDQQVEDELELYDMSPAEQKDYRARHAAEYWINEVTMPNVRLVV